ncbi:MAG: hypothetical protein JNK43_06865 [Ignavibacteria bacterium]|nr:hypothetical protein [Ignavibacteria bacterium]
MMTIPKPGKTRQQLLERLKRFKSDYAKEISENDIAIEEVTDGYRVKAEKKVLFLSFYVDAVIAAKDGEYVITWESNAPENKVNEALGKIRRELEKD